MSNIVRSMKVLSKMGYIPWKTEYYNPWGRVYKDLYGFIDIIAISPDRRETIGVQTTSYSNIWKRKEKILKNEFSKPWLLTGHRILIHGWKDNRNFKEVEVTLKDFEV